MSSLDDTHKVKVTFFNGLRNKKNDNKVFIQRWTVTFNDGVTETPLGTYLDFKVPKEIH